MTTGRPATEHRTALARCVGLGAMLLPTFAPLDVFLCYAVYPDARLWMVWLLRAIAMAGGGVAWWAMKSPRVSDRAAAIAHAAGLVWVALSIVGMCHEFGGPTTLYINGLSVIIMVRSATVPAPVAESLFHGLLVALTYPVGFAVLYALDPVEHAPWLTRTSLATLVGQYSLVLATIFCGCLGSRASWIAQTQLYQARKLGRYRLEAQIGRGGQGEVWLARDATGKRNVALKLLRSSHASPQAIKLFEREAQLISLLESPHTVRVYDFGASDDGIYYLAMEHLDGADLGALTSSHGVLPAGRALHFAIQACRSLEEAHAKGLVHRDIKPSNLFATKGDHLKLLDFGVARSFAEEDAGLTLTRTGAVRGTPAYMAPEVLRGEAATPASDIYALGATLYHVLTGGPPFSGTDAELISKHLDAPPEPLRARAPRPVDPDLEAVVMRCLAKAPAQRYGSAAALRAALERCAAAAPWTAADAARFWSEDRPQALARFEAETVA